MGSGEQKNHSRHLTRRDAGKLARASVPFLILKTVSNAKRLLSDVNTDMVVQARRVVLTARTQLNVTDKRLTSLKENLLIHDVTLRAMTVAHDASDPGLKPKWFRYQ